jgi:ABC-type uncharacterized transport system substrate-binding protein
MVNHQIIRRGKLEPQEPTLIHRMETCSMIQKRCLLYTIAGFLAIAMVFGSTGTSVAADRVLLVHSYHEGYAWVDAITAGVIKGLEGGTAELAVFYMDTKRKTGEAWKMRAARSAAEKVASFKPDVIITSDDNAQSYFAKQYAGKTGPKVVFCGVNAEPSAYGFPAANVTGILERPHVIESMALLKALFGGIKTAAVILDDSPTSDSTVDYMKMLAGKTPLEIVRFDQPSTFDQWKTLIGKYQNTVDALAVFVYHTVKEKAGGDSIPSKEIMDWTMANNRLPSVGFLDFSIEDGLLCGIVESGEEHGFLAAQMALQILKGKAAGDIPVRTARKGTVMFNAKTARKLGVDIVGVAE